MMFFFFKQKTAYEMRISDWSSDVCSSDLPRQGPPRAPFVLAGISDEELKQRSLLRKLATPVFNLPEENARNFVPGEDGFSRFIENLLIEAAALTSPVGTTTTAVTAGLGPLAARSEERRVGTECVRT